MGRDAVPTGTNRLGGVRVGLVVAVAALVAVVGGVRAGLPAWAGDPGTEQQLFQLTNQDRTSNGLGSLSFNSNLGSIATNQPNGNCGGVIGRSEDMINRNYFSHQIPPCGQYVWNVFNLGSYTAAGENIGWNNYAPDQSVGQVNTAFMNSPDHRANILGNYSQMGTGAWAATGAWTGGGGSYNGVIMYTEIFIKTASGGGGGAPPPPPPPPPRPTVRPTSGGGGGGGGGGTVAVAPPPVAPAPSPSPSLCSLPTNLGEADRNSPAPALASDGGQPPCPSPHVEEASPSPSGTSGASGHEVVGAEREAAPQGLLESVVDRVLRLFLNV